MKIEYQFNPDNKYIGQHILPVVSELVYNHIDHRIVMEDGKARIVTCDYNPERLNLYVENSIITKIDRGWPQ